MIKKIKTSIAFAKNLFVTGAITETSRETEVEICKYIPKGENKIIVEFGMGHGNITKEILNNISSTSKVSAHVRRAFCLEQKRTNSQHFIKKYEKWSKTKIAVNS